MATIKPEREMDANQITESVLAPTVHGRYIQERGLLYCDQIGVSYKLIARSWGHMVTVVGIVAWGVLLILNAFSGGFVGFIWNLAAVFALAFVLPLPFHLVTRYRVLSQERIAKGSGFDAVKALEESWSYNWDRVGGISVVSGPRPAVELKAASGYFKDLPHKFNLAGKDKVLDYANSADVAVALRKGVQQYAPDKLAD